MSFNIFNAGERVSGEPEQEEGLEEAQAGLSHENQLGTSKLHQVGEN